MPRPRRQDGVRLLLRASGWEAKKRKSQTSEQAAQYLISSFPAPQPPSSPAVPVLPSAGPGAIAARQNPPLPATLLPQLADLRASSLGAGDANLDAAEQSSAAVWDAKPHRWPATIALLPDGRISGPSRVDPPAPLTSGVLKAVWMASAPSTGLAAVHNLGSSLQVTCSWVRATASA